jgi:hypothetical protein
MVIATIPLAHIFAGNIPSVAYLVIGGLAIIWGGLRQPLLHILPPFNLTARRLSPTVEGVLTLTLGVGLAVFGLVNLVKQGDGPHGEQHEGGCASCD